MTCPRCSEPQWAWMRRDICGRCGWWHSRVIAARRATAEHWDAKLAAIEAECEDIEDVRDAMRALAEPGPLISWDDLKAELFSRAAGREVGCEIGAGRPRV